MVHAVDTAVRPPGTTKKFDPAQLRDDHGRWAATGALVHGLLASMKDAGSHGSGLYFDDDHYLDWSTRKGDGFLLEVGDGADAVQLDLSHDDMRLWHDSLTRSLRDHDDDGFDLSEDGLDHRGLYWAPLDEHANDWELSVIDADGKKVSFDWPVDRMRQLHAALTLQLLQDALHPVNS